MIRVGLTGGIGSGKSTVARLLADLGAVVVDADRLAGEAIAPGTPGLSRVVEEFGPDVLTPDGSVDRPKLAALVFGEPDRLAALENIVHPEVTRRSDELAASAPRNAVVVFDVPLLVEKRLAGRYDVVVVVDATLQTQIDRLVTARGMSKSDVRSRLDAQATREERLAVADYVIVNDGDLQTLYSHVQRLWRELKRRT